MSDTKRFGVHVVLLRAVLGFSTLCPAIAQDSEQSFFAGKTVRLVVGFGPGGEALFEIGRAHV